MIKALPARCDVAAAVASLANELLTAFPGRPDGPALLDRLRRRLTATDAVVWACEGKVIWRVLRAGRVAQSDLDATLDLDLGGMGIQRLRHAGTVLCLAGDVTGLEPLVPRGVRSFAAAATVAGEAVTYVLVVGWSALVPPCSAADVVPLQVAAALLAGTLTVSLPPQRSTPPARRSSPRSLIRSRSSIATAESSGPTPDGPKRLRRACRTCRICPAPRPTTSKPCVAPRTMACCGPRNCSRGSPR